VNVHEARTRLRAALGTRPRQVSERTGLVPAAVLVPITDRGEPHLVFTKKTDRVPHHRGQFSFPGGIVDPEDRSRVETALREAWEEIRLPAAAVDVIGLLDDTETRATPFVITPVVGVVTEPVAFEPDGREVERVIEVPLSILMDPALVRSEVWERDGRPHLVHFYQVAAEDVVWGATARIVMQVLDLLRSG